MEPIDLAHKRRLAEADKEQDCQKVTPRDILIESLRAMDAGEIEADKLIVVWCNMEKNKAGWQVANCNRLEVLGLVNEFQHHFNSDS